MLCVAHEGTVVGILEAVRYPAASFDFYDPRADDMVNLRNLARDFVDSFRSDRAIGCPAGYVVDPHNPRKFQFGSAAALAYGFTGTNPDGSASEFNLQYATISGEDIVIIVAAAYDEGGCPGRDDLSGFDSPTLKDLRQDLEALLRRTDPPAA